LRGEAGSMVGEDVEVVVKETELVDEPKTIWFRQ
jgi:hypothetical protein